MRKIAAPYYNAPHYNAPLAWRRALVVLTSFAILQLLFPYAAVLLPSERLLAAAPALWLLDYFHARRYRAIYDWNLSRRIYVFGALIVISLLAWLTFWSLLDWQARELGGRVAPTEPFARCYITAALWIIYYVLFLLLDKGLEWIFRFKNLRPRKLTALFLATILFAPYLFLALQIHRGKIANATNPRAKLGLSYEDISFQARDGVLLRGWFIPKKGSDAAIILCHGVSANKGTFLGIADFLHRAGFNVLMFDFRGHGDSAGYTSSLGFYEARDVAAAAEYLKNRPGVKRIGGYGFSMGGAATLLASPETSAIQCVVADSAYADMKNLARREFSTLPNFALRPTLAVLDFYTWLSIGVSLESLAPQKRIGEISPRPLLLIHGTSDERVPLSQARHNFAAAREPKKLWIVPGATHVLAHRMLGQIYEDRVARFFRGALKMP